MKARGDSPGNLYAAACIMAAVGDGDRALEYMKRAVAAGYDDKGRIKRDPDLDGIRKDRRFGEVMASLR